MSTNNQWIQLIIEWINCLIDWAVYVMTEMLQVIRKHQRELIMETHDAEGRTPLSCAAYHGFVDMVEYLLKKSPKLISVRDKDKDLSYAVHKACLRGHIEVLKAFHAYLPKSLLVRDRCGLTILHVAAKVSQDKLKDVVSYLVGLHEIGQKLLSIKDEDECSPLDLAVSCKNHQIIKILRQSMRWHLLPLSRLALLSNILCYQYPIHDLYGTLHYDTANI